MRPRVQAGSSKARFELSAKARASKRRSLDLREGPGPRGPWATLRQKTPPVTVPLCRLLRPLRMRPGLSSISLQPRGHSQSGPAYRVSPSRHGRLETSSRGAGACWCGVLGSLVSVGSVFLPGSMHMYPEMQGLICMYYRWTPKQNSQDRRHPFVTSC